jgi:hypothetical protein
MFRRNQGVFGKIGTKIFWDHSTRSPSELFIRNRELTIFGTHEQLELAIAVFELMSQIVSDHRMSAGLVEGTLCIPALFLKRIIGQQHQNL